MHSPHAYTVCMDTAADRLRVAREKAGYSTAKEAADAMGVPYNTYAQHENGIRGYPAGRAERYARFFRTEPEWLLYGKGDEPDQGKAPALSGLRPVTRWVPVVGDVQAGVFAVIPDEQPEPDELVPINLPGFDGAQLYALRVSGTSMDLFYRPGARVIICPAAEIGIREGDHVIVRRRRGNEVETTIKEVVKERGGIALWPRSSDPQYQTPIRLAAVRDADEGPEIIGVVVADYNVRPAQPRPLIQL